QAEDGIRDFHVTGVQTCALPISATEAVHAIYGRDARIGDGGWSVGGPLLVTHAGPEPQGSLASGIVAEAGAAGATPAEPGPAAEIGRASCRERAQSAEGAGALQ